MLAAILHLFRPALLVTLLALLTGWSQAAVIERDWLAPGDGLLTYDTTTGFEWLDISETRLADFNDGVTSMGGTRYTDEAIARTKLELLAGGTLEGFVLAKRADVTQLVTSAGVDLSTEETQSQTADNMRQLLRLLDTERIGDLQAGDRHSILAVIDETSEPVNQLRNLNVATAISVTDSTLTYPVGLPRLGFDTSNDFYRVGGFAEWTGLAVYRNAIPEPSSVLLMVGLCVPFAVRSARLRKI